MAEIADEELASLRESAKLAESLKSSQDTLARQLDETKAAYQRDIQAMTSYVQGLQSQGTKGVEEHRAGGEEEELFVEDPKKLRQAIKGIVAESVSESLSPVVKNYAATQIDTQMKLGASDASMPYFGKYGSEIRSMLEADPRIALAPGGIKATYQLILSNHLDEIIEDKLKGKSSAANAEESAAPEVTPTPTPGSPTPPPQPSPVPLVVTVHEPPVPIAGGGSPRSLSSKQSPKLTVDEAFVAQTFNCSPEEYRYYQNDVSPDIFGFRGRRRV